MTFFDAGALLHTPLLRAQTLFLRYRAVNCLVDTLTVNWVEDLWVVAVWLDAGAFNAFLDGRVSLVLCYYGVAAWGPLEFPYVLPHSRSIVAVHSQANYRHCCG